MEEILKATLLFDFYGELLTDKQKEVFEMFHLNDFSLTEIGLELNISRQAVHDQIRRTEKILAGYEEKLKLVERFEENKVQVKSIKKIVEKIENNKNLEKSIIENIEEIKTIA
ncbi:MAG: YlxM family DNA-binding protein, partial [Anaerotignaceae bacterium]